MSTLLDMPPLAWRGGHMRRRQPCARCGRPTRSTQNTSRDGERSRWPKCTNCYPLSAAERLLLAIHAKRSLIELRP